jgi:hypothetical protein
VIYRSTYVGIVSISLIFETSIFLTSTFETIETKIHMSVRYKINLSPETVVEVVSTLHRNVPYFYDTFWVIMLDLPK